MRLMGAVSRCRCHCAPVKGYVHCTRLKSSLSQCLLYRKLKTVREHQNQLRLSPARHSCGFMQIPCFPRFLRISTSSSVLQECVRQVLLRHVKTQQPKACDKATAQSGYSGADARQQPGLQGTAFTARTMQCLNFQHRDHSETLQLLCH